MSDDDLKGVADVVFMVTFFVSSLCSSIIPLMYYYFGKCKGHPMNLIAMICLLEMISNWNFLLIGLDVYQVESTIHLKNIFDALTFDVADLDDQNFCKFNDGFFVVVETLIISFNLFFAFDLYLTLRKPFVQGKKRQTFYNILALLLTLCLFIFMIDDLAGECDIDRNFEKYYFPPIMTYFMSVYMAVALLIIIYSTMVLRHKQNQNNTRGQYIIHHRRVLISLFVCWLLPTVNNIGSFRAAITNTYTLNILQYISFMFLMLTGTAVNIARLSEPHVLANVYSCQCQFLEIVKNLGSCRRRNNPPQSQSLTEEGSNQEQEERREERAEAWNIPLSTAINQFNNQYVLHNIIQTVLELSKNTSQEELSHTFKMTQSEAERLLDHMKPESIKDVSRLKKKLELVCISYENETESSQKRTVFRKDQMPSVSPAAETILQEQNSMSRDAVIIKAAALSHVVFEKIRELSNINYEQLEVSLDVNLNNQSIKKTKESLGASGSFFFFSHDHRFVIKTIEEGDVSSLLDLLPHYYLHLMHEPNSILSRIFGLYTIEIANVSSITFILMENSFSIFDQMKLSYRKYDMKGSTVSRQVRNRRAEVLKDVNFLKSEEAFLYMRKDEKEQLLRQIDKDISLLSERNIMDYSLLLGVADLPTNALRDDCGRYNWRYVSSCRWVSRRIYSLSLIDYLQKFNYQKQMQLKYKTFFSSKTLQISSINSKDYRKRFLRFMNSIIVVVN